ncbi:MAG: nucleotidyltransferase family protein, partial [Firmicutes bacterium]|nr:nucleotidyltransferase family protein [Bacillota bacterium]
MKAYGIIAEYNPFHNGHRYHIEETRRRTGCDAVAVVMSGDFVQRGEPALLDKWTRAEAALRCGADLVLELPAVFACSSAEHFAFGGVGILEGLGVPDGISFGAEADLPEE